MRWTKQDETFLMENIIKGKTVDQISKELGRSWTAVNNKAHQLKKNIPNPDWVSVGAAAEPEQDEQPAADYWKKRAKTAEKALADSQHDKTAAEIVAENILEMAPKSYRLDHAVKPAKLSKSKHGAPQSAVLLFSDTHIGAVVKPEQTLELGQYSFEIFLRRLARLERSVESILADHTTTAVPEIVVPMLGDMLDGALVHSAECGQSNTMLEQFYSGGHAIAQFFRNLSRIAPLRIYGTVGNHTRWGQQHRMPTKNRNSNFDMLLYLYIQALVRDVPGIEWHLDYQPFARFEVQDYPFYCAHGDNVRGGDKMLGIPNHSLGRMVSTTTQLFARKGMETPAYYCLGHLHRPIEIPHARGQVIVNGAFPGIDGYALSEYFNSSYPIQKFWLMHPKFGRSATYDLRLDLGDETPHDYTLPNQFNCK